MSSQEPLVFANRAGLRLFGILHTPADPRPGAPAIILLSPGVKMRVGPQRLYRRMAEQFAAAGLIVFRFDFYGLGDSEGTLTEELLRDVYNHIEVGRFVDDTLDAMDWMQRQTGVGQFILSGLCGGAITGLLAGARDRRVVGLLALGITPVLASRSADPSLYMTRGQLDTIGHTYLQKLAKPSAWLRLLTFKTDYRLLWRSLVRRRQPVSTAGAAAPPEADNASPLFPPAFFEMLKTERPMLLVFGGSDRLFFEFEEKFLTRHTKRLSELPVTYEVHVVAKANHVLSSDDWQQQMLALSMAWLNTHFA
jgi:alpha/beta superfamily hydrolase